MAKVIVPGFRKIYKERQNFIDKEIKSAEALIEEAEKLRQNYENNLIKAKEEHNQIINETISGLQKNIDKKIHDLEIKLSSDLKQQKIELDSLTTQSEKDIENIAIESAAMIINKISRHGVDKKKLNKYIN
jgi:F0F1-type ATP synthase membrane subunit b/b'